VSIYETDDEKAEAIKKWWKENGLSIVAGVTIGLVAIFGWRAWVNYRDSVAQQASAAFEQLLTNVESEDPKIAIKQSELLTEEFSSTTYATLAILVQAKKEVDAGNLMGARKALERAIAESPDPGLTRIAALRLIRVLIAEGDTKKAATLAAKHDDDASFAGAFAVVRGDIARAEGRLSDARAAYEQAIAAGAPNPGQLRLKLDDLPPAS
jgi:predicted negative regulator of RcsB-dependent stress response